MLHVQAASRLIVAGFESGGGVPLVSYSIFPRGRLITQRFLRKQIESGVLINHHSLYIATWNGTVCRWEGRTLLIGLSMLSAHRPPESNAISAVFPVSGWLRIQS